MRHTPWLSPAIYIAMCYGIKNTIPYMAILASYHVKSNPILIFYTVLEVFDKAHLYYIHVHAIENISKHRVKVSSSAYL